MVFARSCCAFWFSCHSFNSKNAKLSILKVNWLPYLGAGALDVIFYPALCLPRAVPNFAHSHPWWRMRASAIDNRLTLFQSRTENADVITHLLNLVNTSPFYSIIRPYQDQRTLCRSHCPVIMRQLEYRRLAKLTTMSQMEWSQPLNLSAATKNSSNVVGTATPDFSKTTGLAQSQHHGECRQELPHLPSHFITLVTTSW